MIHPTAIVEQGAGVADDVSVGPYAIIESGAIVGAGCELAAGVIIRSGTVLGAKVRVDSYSVIGGLPQDLHFDARIKSGVEVGPGTVIREHVTIHRSTEKNGMTRVGANCLLMATCHIAHDCTVGDEAIIANGIMLAGHVQIGSGAFLGGNTSIHQHVRVGDRVMLGGQSALTRDIPPYCMAAERDHLVGLNIVGLRRSGFSRDEIAEIKRLFHVVFDGEGSPKDKAARVPDDEIHYACGHKFIDFFKSGKRGFLHKFDAVPAEE
jgi:UDP-N-acetylglucosamine acyltransferase